MKKLIMLTFIFMFSVDSCNANLANAYTYTKSYESLDVFFKALEKDSNIIIMDLTLNPGEVQEYIATITYHTDSGDIYEYHYIIVHHGLTYTNYFTLRREESRKSGGPLFQGDWIDEEITHESLIIRSKFTEASLYNGPMSFTIAFFFTVNGIGFYGEIVHVNEISENFDKQVFIDYIIELYEGNKSVA